MISTPSRVLEKRSRRGRTQSRANQLNSMAASSFSSLAKKLLSRSLLSPPPTPAPLLARLCTTTTTPLRADESDPDDPKRPDDSDSPSQPRPPLQPRPLENGLDPGVYKAIMVGKVGQRPVQKTLRSGRGVVLLSLGTGGIRNNRRPLDDEEPREYAERCAVQWHRVAVYPARLAALALKHVQPGSILYLEGNLETKVFSDPITGLVRRIREIAIRRDGRLVFLGNNGDSGQSEQGELRSVGYY